MPEDPLVLVNNRVPKAGSSTMLSILNVLAERNNFSLVTVPMSDYHDHKVITGHINAALASSKKTLVADHFFFPDAFDERVRYINVLREPVDRCVSTYYYARTSMGHEKFLEVFANVTLDECMAETSPWNDGEIGDKPCLNCQDGAQLRYLLGPTTCGQWDMECDKVPVDQRASAALKNVHDHFTVGLMENMKHTLELFENKYPTFFDGAHAIYLQLGDANVNSARQPASRCSLELLRQRLRQDGYLYSAAARQFYSDYIDCVLDGRTIGGLGKHRATTPPALKQCAFKNVHPGYPVP